MPSPSPDTVIPIPLGDEPGHLIRRAQQIAVATFHLVHGRQITPIQYAILRTLAESPGIDQITLAQLVALDTSTAADIAARLEGKGWVAREVLTRRQRSLSLTPAGQEVLAAMGQGVSTMQGNMLSVLEPQEQTEFLRLLRKFVEARENMDTQGDDSTERTRVST
jgi:DNA-binding MarR family transcriptional regulator